MEINTASAAISFAKKLEEDSAKFYEDLAQRCMKDRETLLSFAKENRRNAVHIERAYYEVITDAIEGCFTFAIEPDEYTLKTSLTQNTRYSDALDKAIDMEERIVKFYLDASQQSKSLMADIPRAFIMVAKKRDSRRPKLMELLAKES